MEPDNLPASIQSTAGEVAEQEEEFGPQDEGNDGNEEDVDEILSNDENDEAIGWKGRTNMSPQTLGRMYPAPKP